jgi:hypothetical protein
VKQNDLNGITSNLRFLVVRGGLVGMRMWPRADLGVVDRKYFIPVQSSCGGGSNFCDPKATCLLCIPTRNQLSFEGIRVFAFLIVGVYSTGRMIWQLYGRS